MLAAARAASRDRARPRPEPQREGVQRWREPRLGRNPASASQAILLFCDADGRPHGNGRERDGQADRLSILYEQLVRGFHNLDVGVRLPEGPVQPPGWRVREYQRSDEARAAAARAPALLPRPSSGLAGASPRFLRTLTQTTEQFLWRVAGPGLLPCLTGRKQIVFCYFPGDKPANRDRCAFLTQRRPRPAGCPSAQPACSGAALKSHEALFARVRRRRRRAGTRW